MTRGIMPEVFTFRGSDCRGIMPEVARMEGGSGSEPVQLQPFIHQVGGHTSMLQYDSTTLCKPCIPREQSFYNDMPNALKQFAPEFRGTCFINCVKFI